jgi:hypothetical protein
MIRLDLQVFIEAETVQGAVSKVRGVMESLDDARYYEQGAVVHWKYTGKQISSAAAQAARLERYRQDQEEAEGPEELEDTVD